ncbi:LytTR family DNA-binding domain-containing protein [Albimonas sp. CAU 1670]|uniref:LytTR family DNA-binding domain-containing protein n=1 Tax=Albimonas sp. CAU 1670 TaxID=3032599 RepID=UPI0023D9C1F8|nr:LytTR family DNA-binding domain-containing protein [Albimonas sp. CAU 1670]MDF2232138.1 LytTR family DNA-binding domain-containing protein [Albimonas sp. CAU 1670]
MNHHSVMHLALREMRARLTTGRIWLAFGSTVLLFILIAPFGTREQLSTGGVAAYWAVLHTGCWGLAIFCASFISALRPKAGAVEQVLLSVGSAAVPISILVVLVRHLFLGTPVTSEEVVAVLPLSLGLTLALAANARLTATTLAHRPLGDAGGLGPRETPHDAPPPPQQQPPATEAPRALDPAPAPSPAAFAPRLMERLSPARRGALLRLSMQDHYVEVATDRGAELVLMRLGDAIAECDPVEGLQVHRSHWVARAAVVNARRDGDRAILRLSNGERIPVSRGRVPALREAGWL